MNQSCFDFEKKEDFLSCPCRAKGFELLRYPQEFCFALIVQSHGVQCVLHSSRTCVNCQASLMHQCNQQTGDTFQTCKSTYLPNPSEFPPVPAHSLQPVSALYGMTRAVCMTFLRSFASPFLVFLYTVIFTHIVIKCFQNNTGKEKQPLRDVR